jgi:hypothetical protein
MLTSFVKAIFAAVRALAEAVMQLACDALHRPLERNGIRCPGEYPRYPRVFCSRSRRASTTAVLQIDELGTKTSALRMNALACTGLNWLCYNSVTEQGQMLWSGCLGSVWKLV